MIVRRVFRAHPNAAIELGTKSVFGADIKIMRGIISVIARQGAIRICIWIEVSQAWVQELVAGIVVDSIGVTKKRAQMLLQLPGPMHIEQMLYAIQLGGNNLVVEIFVP